MSDSQIDPESQQLLDDLAGKMLTGGSQVVPFIGAGLSAPFGIPIWSAFLRETNEILRVRDADAARQVDHHLLNREFEETAEIFETRIPAEFQGRIDHDFGPNEITIRKIEGGLPGTAVNWLPILFPGPVFTTNLDGVIEIAYILNADNHARAGVGQGPKDLDHIVRTGLKYVVGFHGDCLPSGRVLTRSEYRQHYCIGPDDSRIDFSKPLPHALQYILTSRTVLFIGASLDKDRTVDIIREVAAQGGPQLNHFAILPRPAGDVEPRRKFLEELKIRPIWYPRGHHEKVAGMLESMARIVAPERFSLKAGPLSPPLALPPEVYGSETGIPTLLTHLERMGFVWVRPEAPKWFHKKLAVYWPVRLRRLHPIHCIQAFVAGALMRQGVRVHLIIDDHGTLHGATPEMLEGALRRFIAIVHPKVERDQLVVNRFTEVFEDHRPGGAGPWIDVRESVASARWDLLASWVADPEATIASVLKLAGIQTQFTPEPALASMGRVDRPRRILTPPLVWSAAQRTKSSAALEVMLTLGGINERPLWEEAHRLGMPRVMMGHIYAPVLVDPHSNPIRMGKEEWEWDGRHDIIDHLDELEGKDDAITRQLHKYCIQVPCSLLGRSVSAPETREKMREDLLVLLLESKLPPDGPRTAG